MPAAKTTSALSLVLLAFASFGTHGQPQCPGGEELTFLPDPRNCSVFYMCAGNQRWQMTCGANVFNPQVNVCVGRGSEWDTCTTPAIKISSTDTCSESNDPNTIIGKADNCAQYYNCSSEKTTVSSNPHLVECQYPSLFSLETQSCQPFETVTCGDRWEPVDACEYIANTCQRAHCIPCNIRFGTCRGKPDGQNPWVGKEDSPYYVTCENQRVVDQGMCKDSNGTYQLFDKLQRVCVPFTNY